MCFATADRIVVVVQCRVQVISSTHWYAWSERECVKARAHVVVPGFVGDGGAMTRGFMQDYGYQQYGQGKADRSRTPQAPRHASVNLTMGVENERARMNRAPSPYRPATRYASPMPGRVPQQGGYESRTPRYAVPTP